ncbi:cytochrome c oxidase assembly protein [Stakelama saccharophila]|uniref:Cytochrome c oxidase assembly protein n=1 Tax=Stakelama saccharophila TaxID=3075605 RepID=A0ABZ0B701_9SPHN|nr:cytochrome c oxidase assembly protein [Stakelama sp. W311]WNO53158.1 cytochrome c oxidase assembly protein [Stakelama sp. W311]
MPEAVTIGVRAARLRLDRNAGIAAAIVALGLLIWWGCRYRAADMPAWAPWDFSALWYAAYALTGWAYVRGLRGAPQPVWRIGFFAIGMAVIWAVLQTRFEYLAQHMFFLNRIQHVVMHHLGPFLIAVAWPWPVLYRGLPKPLRGAFDHRHFQRFLRFMQQPEIACGLFLGLIGLWLYPPVHFVAMIDPALYQVMNWSMVVDGVLFWSVVLDPRGKALAHNSFAVRAVMGVAIMFPQIALGAVIAFADTDLYGFYAWCGRIYPSIDALSDQRIGGLIVWIPPAMMSVLSLILVLNLMRLEEERNAPPAGGAEGSASRGWTGR